MAGKNAGAIAKVTDGSYTSRLTLKPGQYVEVTRAKGKMSGVFVRFFDSSADLTARIQVDDSWQDAATIGRHLTDWMGFGQDVTSFRLVNTSKKNIAIA